MAVYYIASAASGGSSGNTGLSPSSPWPLSKLNTFEAAGDMVLINKGDTLTGTTTITRSGTSGNPITYDIYGSSTNNPILDGAGSTTNRTLRINGSFIVVKNLTIQNSFVTAFGTLMLSANHDVTISNCHVSQGYRGIHAQNCTGNISIDHNYVELIAHPNTNTDVSSGDGSCIQLDHCNGAGITVTNNKISIISNIGVGDLISLYISSGTIGSPILVDSNISMGGGLTTAGKCGIGMGDNGGQYQTATNNRIHSSGYAGIQIAGGDTIVANNNFVYSPQVTFPGGTGSLKALSVFSTGTAPTNVTAGNNKLNWKDYNGNVNNLYVAAGVATPANWGTNTANSVQDPLAPSTIVANPPFNSGDWNVVVIPVITYSPTYSYVIGVPISPVNPGGSSYYPITAYSISPGLPPGLSFNTTTGQITGTPSALLGSTSFTVTATSIGGQGTFTFSLQVVSAGAIPYYTGIKFI